MNIDSARYALREVQAHMENYTDAELRDIKNSADVFSMHIRMELAARDARMVDEAVALQEKAK